MSILKYYFYFYSQSDSKAERPTATRSGSDERAERKPENGSRVASNEIRKFGDGKGVGGKVQGFDHRRSRIEARKRLD